MSLLTGKLLLLELHFLFPSFKSTPSFIYKYGNTLDISVYNINIVTRQSSPLSYTCITLKLLIQTIFETLNTRKKHEQHRQQNNQVEELPPN